MAIKVSAIPMEGHAQYYRAGQKWTAEPVEVKVVDAPSAPYEITREQLEVLRKDARIKVDGDLVLPTSSPDDDAKKKAEAEAARLDEERRKAAEAARAEEEARRSHKGQKPVREG